MRRIKFCQLFLIIVLGLFTSVAMAWDHSIEFGYGFSHDPNHTKYNNSGFLLSGDLFPLHRSPWTFWSITGSLGQFRTSAPYYKNLTTGAASLALRIYALDIKKYPGYFLASFGPAILSHRQFGLNKQGKNIAIQSNLGLGMEFNKIDVNLRVEHFSNAGLSHPNQGFNVLYLLSVGYLF